MSRRPTQWGPMTPMHDQRIVLAIRLLQWIPGMPSYQEIDLRNRSGDGHIPGGLIPVIALEISGPAWVSPITSPASSASWGTNR